MALRSGAYLAGREAVGVGIRLAGLVLVMRQIGPSDFGVYSAAAAYVLFATTLAQMGAEVFLVRQPGPLPRRRYDEVFTALLLTSGIVVAGGMALSFAVAPWLRPYGVLVPMRVLLLSVPVNVLWAPMQASIERSFAYRRMGLLELGGDVILYAVAVPLAFLKAGPWSLVAGFFAWQVWLLFGSMALSGLWPRLAWSKRTFTQLLGHGGTYALPTWIASARTAVLTMIVGTFAGTVGVGLVNFALRLALTLNFTDRGVHRIGMVAISKANKEQPGRLSSALEDGTLLLMVVAALPFAAFGLVARWVIPDVFGHAWLPALPVYVLMAVWATLRVPSTVQRTLLYAFGRNLPAAITSVIEMAIASVVALLLIPRMGIVGYGLATVIAVTSNIYTHFSAHRLVAVRYRRLLLPLTMALPPVFLALVPMPWALLLLAPAVVALVLRPTRRELLHVVAMARSTLVRTRPVTEPVPAVTQHASTLRFDAARVAAAMAVDVRGRPEMVPQGASPNGKNPLMFPPFQAWRMQDGFVGDPTDPRIADRGVALDSAAMPFGLASGARSAVHGADGWSAGALPLSSLLGRSAGAGPERSPAVGPPAGPAGGRDGRPAPGASPWDSVAALLSESDPITSLPSVGMMLARLGRVLGATRGAGWALAVVALRLGRPGETRGPAAPTEELLAGVARELQWELRFDDLVSRAGPATFVVAVPFVGDDGGHQVTAHLEAAVQRAAAGAAAGGAAPGGAAGAAGGAAWRSGWSVRSAREVVPLPCERDADALVRRVVEAVGA